MTKIERECVLSSSSKVPLQVDAVFECNVRTTNSRFSPTGPEEKSPSGFLLVQVT